MNQKQKKMKFSIGDLRERFNLPFSYISSGIDIEIKSDRAVYVDGCIGVEEFTDGRVVFLGKEMKVTVTGEEIELYTFTNGCIRASGIVSSVEIERSSK